MNMKEKIKIMNALKELGTEFSITPRVEMKLSEKKAELYLYGDVVEDDYVWNKTDDYISSKKVRTELNKLNGEDLLIHLNSFGGMTFEGVAVYNLLMDYKGRVDVQIDGIAASAASIIAMAGKTIKGRANTMLMIHKGWTYTYGNAEELRKTASMLDKIDEAADETYMQKFTGTKEELINMINAETFLTAKEAVEKGFYDEVIEDTPEKDKPDPQATLKDQEKPKSLFDLWSENKKTSQAADKAANLFAKFKEAK